MASNYKGIRSTNIKRYGTEISRIGSMLLANRYDEQTHFIFELLQNAEDALRRLQQQQPVISCSISFYLQQDVLRVSHYGDPFTEKTFEAFGVSTKVPRRSTKLAASASDSSPYTHLPTDRRFIRARRISLSRNSYCP